MVVDIREPTDRIKHLDEYVPRPSEGVKFQPPRLFLVAKGLKFQTRGRFSHIFYIW